MKNAVQNVNYFNILRKELGEIATICKDVTLNKYQKETEQGLLESEYDIIFSEKTPETMRKKLLELDKKGLKERYHVMTITPDEFKYGMELLREESDAFVPEDDQKYGGLSNVIPDFLKNEDAILGLTGEYPTPGRKAPVAIDWKAVLAAAGVVAAATTLGFVYKYKTDKQFTEYIDANIEQVLAQIFGTNPAVSVDSAQDTLSPDPVTVPVVNVTATPNVSENPARFSWTYKGNASENEILVIGNSPQFIKDVAVTLGYLGEFDSNDKLRCTNEIEEENKIYSMNALFGNTGVNASYLHEHVVNGHFEGLLTNKKHEDIHSCDGPGVPDEVSEKNAKDGSIFVWDVLVKVPKSEKQRFINSFDYSQIEKEITTI